MLPPTGPPGLPSPAFPPSHRHDELADRPGHDFRHAVSNAKIEADLGWRPTVDLEAGIGRTVRWYLDHEPWWAAIRERGFSGGRLGLKRA